MLSGQPEHDYDTLATRQMDSTRVALLWPFMAVADVELIPQALRVETNLPNVRRALDEFLVA